MVKRKPFGKLTIAMGICALAFGSASCTNSNDDNFPDAYGVTVTAIEMEDKDSGQPIEVGGETISGLVYIEPGSPNQ